MRFLIVSAAILACASAGLIAPLAPLAYGINHGDAQAAAIDATVAAQDHTRAVVENHNAAAEQAAHHNTEALRSAAETSRDIHENAYWGSFDAARSAESALSGHAAAADGYARSLAPAYGAYGAYGHGLVAAAPYALPYAAGLPYAGYGHAGYAGLAHAGYGHAGLAHAGYGHAGLAHAGYGHAGLVHAW